MNHPSEILSIGDVVPVKVLDIDRERQRISLGLKQTQADPWQRVIETYQVGDELEGKVTKVVSFGAFVEILDGVEGLVHISELAQHHVESPREVVNQGDELKVKILEIESERRRLSLSVKRVEGQDLPIRELGPEELGEVRDLDLSDEVFPEGGGEPGAEAAAEEAPVEAEVADEPVAEGAVEEAPAEAEPEAEPEAVVEEAPAEAEAEPEAAAPAEDEPTQE